MIFFNHFRTYAKRLKIYFFIKIKYISNYDSIYSPHWQIYFFFYKQTKLIIIFKTIIILMHNALEHQKAGAISFSTDDKMITFVVMVITKVPLLN